MRECQHFHATRGCRSDLVSLLGELNEFYDQIVDYLGVGAPLSWIGGGEKG